MTFYLHPQANCFTNQIGEGTRIWRFTSIAEDVIIGRECNICDFVFIERKVLIGNNVTVKSGVYLWTGIVVKDNVFIGPNATFTNDKFPRSGDRKEEPLSTILEEGCSIGANATILPGITIGKYAMIGAGSVVTKDVPDLALVQGNPARIVRFLDSH